MNNFNVFVNISILTSVLLIFLPLIDRIVDLVGFLFIWIFKKIYRITLLGYMSIITFVWIALILGILNNILNKSIEHNFNFNSINLSNSTYEVVEQIFNHSTIHSLTNNK